MLKILEKIINIKNKSKKDIQFKKIKNSPEIIKLFECFSKSDSQAEIRFVGGFVRKVLTDQNFDDVDLAVNLNPEEVKNILNHNNINFYETGIEHGTLTAIINKKKFEITSLRNDLITDGRHAKVQYTKMWSEDASRRDFTINSIYADLDGNIYDPNNGKTDLNNGIVRFIGDPEKRIKEDYLRIIRYLRFFSIYSSEAHSNEVCKAISKNISGIKNLSKERIIDELKKIFLSGCVCNISKDDFSLKIFNLIFPELKNITILKKFDNHLENLLNEQDFILFLSLILIDETDDTEYFLYKYNLSNIEKKRIKFLKGYHSQISSKEFFSEKNLSKIHYIHGNPFIIDIINFKILKSRKISTKLIDIKKKFTNKQKPIFPVKAQYLIDNFNLKEGKDLGRKLKKLENIWMENNFQISNKQIVDNISD